MTQRMGTHKKNEGLIIKTIGYEELPITIDIILKNGFQ